MTFRTNVDSREVGWVAAFFVFGALLHLSFWRWYIHLTYATSPPDSRTFVDARLTNIAIPVVTGVSVTFFFRRFLGNTLRRAVAGLLETILRAGFYGLAATFCGFEAFYLLASVYLAASPHSPVRPPTISMIPGVVPLLMIEFASFGAMPVAACLPFSFLFGSIAGFAIWKQWKHRLTAASA
jgi:hypothetical protein